MADLEGDEVEIEEGGEQGAVENPLPPHLLQENRHHLLVLVGSRSLERLDEDLGCGEQGEERWEDTSMMSGSCCWKKLSVLIAGGL